MFEQMDRDTLLILMGRTTRVPVSPEVQLELTQRCKQLAVGLSPSELVLALKFHHLLGLTDDSLRISLFGLVRKYIVAFSLAECATVLAVAYKLDRGIVNKLLRRIKDLLFLRCDWPAEDLIICLHALIQEPGSNRMNIALVLKQLDRFDAESFQRFGQVVHELLSFAFRHQQQEELPGDILNFFKTKLPELCHFSK